MYDLDKAYSKKFFARRKSLAWRIPIVCDAIIEVLKPKSVIDVGCGNGDLVKGFRDKNIRSYGIEGTYNALIRSLAFDYIYIDDLRQKLNLPYAHFDLTICFEVAEHIEPEYTDIFLDNLCSVSDRILFSAAGPGQGGLHHHNCQPKEYWAEKFKDKNYASSDYMLTMFEPINTKVYEMFKDFDKDKSKDYCGEDIKNKCLEVKKYMDLYSKCVQIKKDLLEKWHPWRNKKGIKAYYQNLMYFEKG